MPIIQFSKSALLPQYQYLNIYPNTLVPEKTKETDDYIKNTLDYFHNVAINQYAAKKKSIERNYDLLKGILKPEDLYEKSYRDFKDDILPEDELPHYVVNYSIMTPVINTLTGELSKRPDNTYVKAFDDDSKAEELQFRTSILQEYIMQTAKQKIISLAATQGVELPTDDSLEQMTQKQVEEYLTNYTSLAERWGSRMLENLKVRFNLKEKSEDAFRDLVISGEQFFHIFEDDSPEGLNVEVKNPKNVWYLTTPDQKYTSDPMDKTRGAYAAGTIDIMELSEILHKFKLTEAEVKHLHEYSQQNWLLPGRESTQFTGETGVNSVHYETYDPLVLQTRQMLEADSLSNTDNQNELDLFLGIANSVSTFGTKYLVTRTYYASKKKVGKLTYIDEDQQLVSILVDENYKNKSHPMQISLEWGWITQWYQGTRIGPDIYYHSPLEILDYCPIIGSFFEIKNTQIRSYVDLMKPFQTYYNIYINKLYESINKDLGPVLMTDIRQLATPKDGDPQDAIDVSEAEMRARAILYLDNSPENTKGANNFNQHSVLNASRVQEMQGYLSMAQAIKIECWELMGITRQRMGSVQATETATATNAALSQSYAQTEPVFTHHEYTLNKFYQALLDAAQYIESSKPESTLSYISTEGEQAFIKINGPELKLKNLGVYVTSRAEDARNLQEMKTAMVQALTQNDGIYEASLLFTTKSQREIKDAMKRLKEQKDNIQAQQQQLQQDQLKQQQQQFQQQEQIKIQQHLADQQFEANENELNRLSKEKIAIITATGFGKTNSEDLNQNQIPDVLEITNLQQQQSKIQADQQTQQQKNNIELQKLLQNNLIEQQKLENEREKLKMEKYKADTSLKIAKENKNSSEINKKKK